MSHTYRFGSNSLKLIRLIEYKWGKLSVLWCVRRWASPLSQTRGWRFFISNWMLIRTGFIIGGNHNWCVCVSIYCVFAQLEEFRMCVLCCISVPHPPAAVCEWAVPCWSGGHTHTRASRRGDEDDLNGRAYRPGAPLAVPWVYCEHIWIKLHYIMFSCASLCVE